MWICDSVISSFGLILSERANRSVIAFIYVRRPEIWLFQVFGYRFRISLLTESRRPNSQTKLSRSLRDMLVWSRDRGRPTDIGTGLISALYISHKLKRVRLENYWPLCVVFSQVRSGSERPRMWRQSLVQLILDFALDDFLHRKILFVDEEIDSFNCKINLSTTAFQHNLANRWVICCFVYSTTYLYLSYETE